MAYRCKNYKLQELVSPLVYAARGEEAWEMLDEQLLRVIDRIADKFGPVIINNWMWGGRFDLRGLRHYVLDKPKCLKEGIWIDYGQHEPGRAVDMSFPKHTVKEVREYILAHPEEFPEIRGIEVAKGWLHIDVRNSLTVEVFNA